MGENKITVGVIGAGTMGTGIAQLAATCGHSTIVFDSYDSAITKSKNQLEKILKRQVEKGRMSQVQKDQTLGRIRFVQSLEEFASAGLVIEAVVEDLEIKNDVFSKLESIVSKECILATNTSSLSITAIASTCELSERVIGIHFFNPAPLMPLVEIIAGLTTKPEVVTQSREIIDSWGKTTVLAKDTPGFIVNRVARPFYGEALRIYEEGIADFATIDWAMREVGGFRMGPFELMDFIGNDVNYQVTLSVFAAFFYDPRFKPSFTQKRICEAKFFGRKVGRGYYDYRSGAINPEPNKDKLLGQTIFIRILVMLINEAIDAVFLHIASPQDVDLAMTKGVNYPKGLLAWANEMGLHQVLIHLEELQEEYGEDRYRPNPLLKRMVRSQKRFFSC